MYHPWRAFRALTPYRLFFAGLPDGVLGVTDFGAQVVVIADDLDQAERRSTIAHEVEHIHRGFGGCHGREECAVELGAARKLIGIRELGEALAWAHDLAEAAEELWVDEQMLRTRLDHLHPAERHYLRRRLQADDAVPETDPEAQLHDAAGET